jgi:hypothetical protein
LNALMNTFPGRAQASQYVPSQQLQMTTQSRSLSSSRPLSAAQESPLQPEGRASIPARGAAERDRSVVRCGPRGAVRVGG